MALERSLRSKRGKNDESLSTSLESIPMRKTRRPFRKLSSNVDLGNISYMSSDSSLSNRQGKENESLNHQRSAPFRKIARMYEAVDVSCASSCVESSRSVDTTMTSSPKVRKPFRVLRSEKTLANISLDLSINNSIDKTIKKRQFSKKTFSDESMAEISFASSQRNGQSFQSDGASQNLDIVTPRRGKKSRPFKVAPLDHSIKDVTYTASQEPSLNDTSAHLPFRNKTFEESLPDATTVSQDAKKEESFQEASLRRSVRLSNKSLTPLEKTHRPFQVSISNSSMKETSYLASQENSQQTTVGNNPFRRGIRDNGSVAEISYEDSLLKNSIRSEALSSENESESNLDDSVDNDSSDLRNATTDPNSPAHLSIPQPRESSFGPSISLNDDSMHSRIPGKDVTISPSTDIIPTDARARARQNIQQILKEASEKAAKKYRPFDGRLSPLPKPKPPKRTRTTRMLMPRPKIYKPAPWANKHLYKFLGNKLRPQFGLRYMLKAEEVVKLIYETVCVVEKNTTFQKVAVNRLKLELATLHIIETTVDFYQFIRSFLPTSCNYKMIPCLQPITNIVWPPKDDIKHEWEKILD